ncbi:trichohyalin isoform X2 [Esox lucius]|uniref:trichohyalin isoform X2 n=1 Tax=Esox lucius TaxID=8010 RepID=UPI001476CE98|nr:trichohyalin isoform X2 [Esox lucius]
MRERDGMKERDGVRERDGRETRTRDRRDPETEREVTQPRLKGEKEEQMELERIRQRERYPDREDEEKRCKEKQDRETVSNMEEEAERETDPIMEQEADRETDPNMEQEADRSSGCMNESGPRAQTQVQSSGEWSSDIEDETKYQRESRERKGSEGEGDVDTEREHSEREKPNRVRAGEDQEEERIPKQPEQRKWWLEPQSGRHNHNSLEDDFLERESDIHSGIQKEKQGGEDTSVDVETERKQSGGNLGGKQRILRDSGRTIERQENIEQGPEGEIESVIETELNVDGEDNIEAWRDSGEEGHQTDNDEKTEETWPANSETEIENETDEIEESDRDEEGHYRYPHSDHQEDSEQKLEGEVERMPSTDDGFITVSSGGEEEFEDCKEFWESELERSRGRRYESERGRTDEQTQPQDAAVEGEGKGNKSSTYVFCVIGQTLSRSNPNQTAALGDMEPQGTYRNPGYDHSRSSDITRFPHEDFSKDGGQEAVEETRKERDLPKEEGLDTEEDSIVDIRSMTLEAGGRELLTVKEKNSNINTTPRRKSLTEVLLTEWRERQKEYAQTTATRTTEPEISPSSSHSREEEQRETSTAATSDHTIPRANSSEEAVAIRHHSGVWGPSETARRLSQAPHVKWARNVLSKILGRSEVPAPDNPPPGSLEGLEVTRDIEDEETSEGGGAALVKATGLKQTKRWMKEPGEGEEATDDEEEGSFNWRSMEKNRRNSKFFNDQLYQQYSETAQNREILRQSRSDTLSVYDDVPVLSSPAPSPPPARRPLPPLPPVNHPHSASDSGSVSGISSGVSAQLLPLPQPPQPQAPTARPPSPRISISLSQSPTLWQELPGVRSSAEFAELTDDERRLQEVRFEVVTSEASYCRSIDIVVEHFVKSKQLGELLTTQDRNWLFSRLADVRAISHSFLSKLEERVESDMMHFTVCDIIARHCQRFKKVYVPYLTNQSYQDATYQRLMDENAGFRREVEKLERSPVCQRLPLRSFLILPFQRITRIKLLVQNIVKRTAQGTEEEVQAIKAMKLLEKLIQESNDSITQMKSIESLVSLSARVDFECRTLPLVSQSRRLVREGPVTELMEFSLKESERIVYLHLFNDYLLLSLHKEGGRFTVIDHAPVSELRAADCRAKLHTLQKSLFRLYLSNKALLLRTDTQSDKLRWISAVSRPHPVIDFAAEQDRTQMQCIRAFVAQQPDELSLEKAEVILVHQQSSDGWVEGTRLSDRQRGWTPVAHLETIASTRVRQRNLLDALKITAATAAM